MKYSIILLFVFGCINCFAQLPKSPKERGWPYPIEMTIEDQSKIWPGPGPGYIMTWYDHDKWIDSDMVFSEIFYEKDFPKMEKGVMCFELNEFHSWMPCDCKPIDKLNAAIRYRYKHDKEFKRKEDSALRSAILRLENDSLWIPPVDSAAEKLYLINMELERYEHPMVPPKNMPCN
jgi:hypothetical protein